MQFYFFKFFVIAAHNTDVPQVKIKLKKNKILITWKLRFSKRAYFGK